MPASPEDEGDGEPAAGTGSATDATDSENQRVNVFRVGDRYYFRHYFEGETAFERLKPYYQGQEYRFEVPAHEYDHLAMQLARDGYDLRVVDPEPFAVVCRKYRSHPENIFKASVYRRGLPDHTVFVLRDRDSVELAVEQGARHLPTTDLSVDLG